MEDTNCCTDLIKPSGHAGHYEPYQPCSYATPRQINFDNFIDHPKCQLDSFAGPYKDFHPPGDRTPAVGEKQWGDVPYLPSYPDEASHQKSQPSGPPDNLFLRGPFFPGVSETHEEYVNRGGIEPKKYHKFVRHYEEPGMKHDRSITQTDFGPPYDMTAKGRHPCLEEPQNQRDYKSTRQKCRNPHLKEVEYRSTDPELILIDQEPERDFKTEYNDNYVCFQKPKAKNVMADFKPSTKEIFLENLQKSHNECPYEIPYHLLNSTIYCHPNTNKALKCRWCSAVLCKCSADDSKKRTPWVLYP